MNHKGEKPKGPGVIITKLPFQTGITASQAVNFLKKNLFDKQSNGHAVTILLKDGTLMNAGIIDVNKDTVEFYTGKGLKELFKSDLDDEKREQLLKDKETLLSKQYIADINLGDIENVF
jgi:hypothetical protein